MKQVFLATILVLATSSSATAFLTVRIKEIGCQNKETMQDFIKMASEDEEKAEEIMLAGLITGDCTLLMPGEQFNVEHVGILSQIRRKGETKKYYTDTSVILRDE